MTDRFMSLLLKICDENFENHVNYKDSFVPTVTDRKFEKLLKIFYNIYRKLRKTPKIKDKRKELILWIDKLMFMFVFMML